MKWCGSIVGFGLWISPGIQKRSNNLQVAILASLVQSCRPYVSQSSVHIRSFAQSLLDPSKIVGSRSIPQLFSAHRHNRSHTRTQRRYDPSLTLAWVKNNGPRSEAEEWSTPPWFRHPLKGFNPHRLCFATGVI